MYPSNQRPSQGGGLTRYVSAPVSLLTSIVDSVIESDEEFSNNVGSENPLMGTHHQYFSADSSSLSTESSCKPNGSFSDLNKQVYRNERVGNGGTPAPALQRSYGLNVGDFATASNLRCGGTGGGGGGGNSGIGSSPLTRHSSSPAGFFDLVDSGFTITKGIGGYSTQAAGTTTVGHGKLKSQLSFTGQDSALSQISEVGESVAGVSNSDEGFTMGSWEDTNTIIFSNPSNKRSKNSNGDIIAGLSDIESQSLFNLSKTSLEMTNVEKLLRLQSDSVPCKIRAKRGFATHPRSIAERERRGRISINLRKLDELVPNKDKQTSTADMLDLAVEHIKVLQGEIQKLNKDLGSCTCGSKQQAT